MDKLIQDLQTKLLSTNVFNWVGIWNNHYEKMLEGKEYAIMNPSAYVELETNNFGQLGSGYQGIDIIMRIHILSEELDAGDGNIDGFISIYGLRDAVVKKFSLYDAYMGGFLIKTNEQQHYDHSNLYHYVIEYTMHYVDDTAVPALTTITGVILSTTVIIK
jgi:hypothetical protein